MFKRVVQCRKGIRYREAKLYIITCNSISSCIFVHIFLYLGIYLHSFLTIHFYSIKLFGDLIYHFMNISYLYVHVDTWSFTI